ncbi:hypothetical protein ACP70R_038852 [Stipagrostis hirtigluma subsp. patula]
MGIENFEHWGVVVRPGETVRCDPGEVYCHLSQIALQAGKENGHVRVFVKVDGKELLIGTLSVDKYPQHTTDLVFEKEFELLHTSKTSNISAIGYKFSDVCRKSDTSSEKDGESDDEAPLAIPLYPNADDDKSKETRSGADKLVAPRAAVTQSSEPKVTLEETKHPGKLKANVDGSDEDSDYSEGNESIDDEDSRDEDDSENPDEDDDEDSPRNAKGKNRPAETSLKTPPEKKSKIAKPSTGKKSSEDEENPKGKNRPAETPLKTPQEKKAKIATPSVGNKTGSGTARQSGHVHVATPYPSKQAKKKTFYQ